MTKQKLGSTKRERRAFSPEYKAEAVRLWLERRAVGVSLAQVARELGVRAESLRLWTRSEQGAAAASHPGETVTEEVRRLRRENAMLRQEQAFAKRSRRAHPAHPGVGPADIAESTHRLPLARDLSDRHVACLHFPRNHHVLPPQLGHPALRPASRDGGGAGGASWTVALRLCVWSSLLPVRRCI